MLYAIFRSRNHPCEKGFRHNKFTNKIDHNKFTNKIDLF